VFTHSGGEREGNMITHTVYVYNKNRTLNISGTVSLSLSPAEAEHLGDWLTC